MRVSENTTIPILALGLFSVVMIFTVALMPYSQAEATNAAPNETPVETSTTVTPLSDGTSLEKTVTTLSIPKDNTLPWAYIDGVIESHAEGHPVIIQFFNEEGGENPIHVAQVDVNDDGSYEYKFRVRDVNLETGVATDIFEGDYTVKIFKVIDSVQENLDAV